MGLAAKIQLWEPSPSRSTFRNGRPASTCCLHGIIGGCRAYIVDNRPVPIQIGTVSDLSNGGSNIPGAVHRVIYERGRLCLFPIADGNA